MVENTNTLKPNTYLTESKVSAKDNKNKKGEVTSQSYSTVIPKPILTKLGLQKGQILYWDIDDEKNIIITPEINPIPVPEEASIEAVFNIFNDMLINGNTAPYKQALDTIKNNLTNTDTSNEDKVKSLVMEYNNIPAEDKDGFKQVVLYLLDYPLNIPSQFEILREVYNKITKSD